MSSTIASKDVSSYTTGWSLTKLGRNDPFWLSSIIFREVSVSRIPRSHRLKRIFEMKNLKIFLSVIIRVRYD